MARQPIQPNIRGENALAQVWAPRVTLLEVMAAAGMSPTEITAAYERTFAASQTRAEIMRSQRSTQSVVVTQNAAALRVSPDEVRQQTGDIPIDEPLLEEIELGLERSLLTWQLDYSRRVIAPEFSVRKIKSRADSLRLDQLNTIIGIVHAGTTREALILLALEAIRKPVWGAEAANSLISHPPTTAEQREAEQLADIAEAALLSDNPTQTMLDVVEMLTERQEYTPGERRTRATNAQTRLARRNVTQTQATTSKDVQTSMGIEGYKWVSQRDGRVRPLHKQLDAEGRAGKVISWAHPDTHGEGNPGDPYGCRCVAVPVIGGTTPFVPEVARQLPPP